MQCAVSDAKEGEVEEGSPHDLLEEGGVQRGKHTKWKVLKERRTTGES